MTLLDFTPRFSAEEAVELARALWGLELESQELLPGERDQNFLLANPGGERFVLKISSAAEDRRFLEAQDAMMRHVHRRFDLCPEAIAAVDGRRITEAEDADGRSHLLRLVTFLEGDTLASVRCRRPELLQDLGRRVGQVDAALADFDHTALHRDFHWDLAKASRVVAADLDRLPDGRQRRLIEDLVERFEAHTAPLLDRLPRSVIHNDANDGNVVVRPGEPGEAPPGVVGRFPLLTWPSTTTCSPWTPRRWTPLSTGSSGRRTTWAIIMRLYLHYRLLLIAPGVGVGIMRIMMVVLPRLRFGIKPLALQMVVLMFVNIVLLM